MHFWKSTGKSHWISRNLGTVPSKSRNLNACFLEITGGNQQLISALIQCLLIRKKGCSSGQRMPACFSNADMHTYMYCTLFTVLLLQ
ncbi:hypothetical protein DUNSADRAFT_18449 [Dunaliella salina]|uniref:Uncharacterized protein n=1 Tax=Dunaliella salina TaxID=3046 RepID=A0ABQ7G053_DUNSA|nr:hypothetical protein DUNSADRAFT_18449 [Dunaliella salina]|eukprot:KAF5827973.1 hypothetical protein DUNSADRAFT_18449 [Dunaliella salina]